MHRVQILAILNSQYKILNAQLLVQIWCFLNYQLTPAQLNFTNSADSQILISQFSRRERISLIRKKCHEQDFSAF